LTNDLTSRVADEAIEKGASVIVTYHPVIFRGLKSITLADTQQTTLLKLARAGVAVYSPHTAVDASPHGLNTWLAGIVSGSAPATTRVIKPLSPASLPAGAEFEGAGYGVAGEMATAASLAEVVHRLASHLGAPPNHPSGKLTSEDKHRPRRLMVARPRGGANPATLADVPVRSFAVCAGSGSDVLSGASDVDLWVTGEVSHHIALKAVEEGRVVVMVFHSNSERQFLRQRMQPWLERELQKEVGDAEVLVSEEDEDPFRIVDVDLDEISTAEHLF
jgi:dinuclear metal center YbgI/SA1388 family protein